MQYIPTWNTITSTPSAIGNTIYGCIFWRDPVITWGELDAIDHGTAVTGAQLNAVLTTGDNGAITYALDNGNAVTPLGGTVLPPGDHWITASVPQGRAYKAGALRRKLIVRKVKAVIEWAPTKRNVTTVEKLSAQHLNAKVKHRGTLVVVTPEYARGSRRPVSVAVGDVLPFGGVELTASFTAPQDADYLSPDPVKATFTCVKVTPTVAFEDVFVLPHFDVKDAGPTATAKHNGLNVTGRCTTPSRVETEEGDKTCEVTFRPDQNLIYESVTKTVPLHVGRPTPVIAWSDPSDIVYGTLLSGTQLCASNEDLKNFVYTPPHGTKLDGGTTTLSVTATVKNAQYHKAPSPKTVQIRVTPGKPKITWNPAATNPNTPLGGAQLCASATFEWTNTQGGTSSEAVAGTFVYNPAANHRYVSAGPQTLSVTFTPTDRTRYQIVTVTAPLTVLWATEDQCRAAGITARMERKILFGIMDQDDGDFIGAHSRDILTDDRYRISNTTTRPSGSTECQVERKMGSEWSSRKPSTLPPPGWDNDVFLYATIQTKQHGTTSSASNGRTEYSRQVAHPVTNARVWWKVVTASNGDVIASYPTS
jgi:hypothetical protein